MSKRFVDTVIEDQADGPVEDKRHQGKPAEASAEAASPAAPPKRGKRAQNQE